MQLKTLMATGALALILTACDDTTGITPQDLEGTWNTTQYQYTNNADPAEQVDLVTQGASFEMTVTASGTVNSTFDDGQGGTSSDGGTLAPDGTTLTIAGNAYEAQRSGDVLTLTDSTSAYDFDSDGSDDPATLVIRMARQ